MLNRVKKNKEGFTIIEVMIVLAIAALILLIVFLAVPALQRNSRNTARKGDVSRVSAAITEFLSNNNGVLPAAGTAASGDAQTIVNNAGSLAQYDFTTSAADQANFTVVVEAAAADANPNDVNKIKVVTKAKCGAAGVAVAGTSRQTAVLYTTESSGGGTNKLCVDQ